MSEIEDILKQRGVAMVKKMVSVNVEIRKLLSAACAAPTKADDPSKLTDLAEVVRQVYEAIKEEMKRIGRTWRDVSGSTVHGDKATLREGKHEWIPTNMIPYLVLMSARWDDISWLGLAEALRCSTRGLVYKKHCSITGTAQLAHVTLTGHVGGLYDQNGTALTTGMGPWHDGLRGVLTKNLNVTENNMADFANELYEYANTTLWGGGITDWKRTLVCTFYKDAKRTESWGATLGDMADEIKTRKELALVLIDNLCDAFKTMHKPSRLNDATAQKMTQDKTVENVYQLLKADLSLTDVDDE